MREVVHALRHKSVVKAAKMCNLYSELFQNATAHVKVE